MTLVTVLGLLVVVWVVAVFVIAARRPGDGADLLDWDPTDRVRSRREADREEVQQGLDEHNRRRAVAGLEPQSEDELRRELARDRRRASS
ncbi:MAG: hypothetical protein JWN65_4116 [Solirubrobacterales bacterium]|jgi:hypothetical protein|nr:hypothetical protein [Solirubrobacterales bacterium]